VGFGIGLGRTYGNLDVGRRNSRRDVAPDVDLSRSKRFVLAQRLVLVELDVQRRDLGSQSVVEVVVPVERERRSSGRGRWRVDKERGLTTQE
jgi:hypothetical protein